MFGFEVLVVELILLGVEIVMVVVCDVLDWDVVFMVFDVILIEYLLIGVFYLVGVLDDGVVMELMFE